MNEGSALNQSEPLQILAKGRVGLFDNASSNPNIVDVKLLIDQIKNLGSEIKSQLVSMDEEIDLVLTALVAGETIFFLSLPGAAKTTMARMIADGIDGQFFRKNITADTSRNDIFGPLDPEKIKRGQWGRKLSGLATASIGNLDEVFRGSGPVLDMLLEALEEHTLSEPDTVHRLPLVLGISASNELVNATIHNAFWDRLIIRKEVNYPSKRDEWKRLLTSAHGTIPIKTRIDPEEIMLLQGLVELEAGKIPGDSIDRMTRIKFQLDKKGIAVSPRRFLAWARVATAHALLHGFDKVGSKSLMVGQHILWITHDDIQDVRDVVGRLSDPERSILLSASADVEKIRSSIGNETTNLDNLSQWQAKIEKHRKLVELKVTDPDLQEKKTELLSLFQSVSTELISRGSELLQSKSIPEPISAPRS
jgi:MoxR-like ATPase